MEVHKYFVGEPLPPHLSPFISEERRVGDYVPPEEKEMLGLNAKKEVLDQDKAEEDNAEEESEEEDEEEGEEEGEEESGEEEETEVQKEEVQKMKVRYYHEFLSPTKIFPIFFEKILAKKIFPKRFLR